MSKRKAGDINMKKLSLTLVLTLLFSNSVYAGFTDIPNDETKDAVNWCIEEGIISGYGDKVNAEENITRAQFAVMMCKFAGYEYNGERADFNDVSANDWFYKYVCVMNDKNIMTGSLGNFNPHGNVTREEAVVSIVRLLNIGEEKDYTVKFSDNNEISQWAKGYIGGAVKAGILEDSNIQFKPKELIKKKEAAELIYICRDIMG